jgi:hypothetical protein
MSAAKVQISEQKAKFFAKHLLLLEKSITFAAAFEQFGSKS